SPSLGPPEAGAQRRGQTCPAAIYYSGSMSGEDPHPPQKRTQRAASRADTADRAAGEVRPPSAPNMLTIVGIGASAGGLQEFEKFFSHVSVQSGLAFVVIQHLAPATRASYGS